MDDVDAEEEDRQRPPRVGAADRQQGSDRAEGRPEDPHEAAERVAAEQQEPADELDQPEDDQDPAQRVQVVEDVPLVFDEDVRPVQSADPLQDVERAGDQQQRRGEHDPTGTAHHEPPSRVSLIGPARWTR